MHCQIEVLGEGHGKMVRTWTLESLAFEDVF